MLELATNQIEDAISRSALVVTYDLVNVRLSISTGYVEGTITFINNFRFAFFEFIRQTSGVAEREKYRYHFMNDDDQLIFRYDNAFHHPEISTFPHHKHLPEELSGSAAPDFTDVFIEIESYVLGII